MNQNLNVSAKTFVQVINEGRQKQSDLYGKWFSSKETGEQLIRKAQQYLDAYRKYVEYLEKVVELYLEPHNNQKQSEISKRKSLITNTFYKLTLFGCFLSLPKFPHIFDTYF